MVKLVAANKNVQTTDKITILFILSASSMNAVFVRCSHYARTKQYTKSPNAKKKNEVKAEISTKTISFHDSAKRSVFYVG